MSLKYLKPRSNCPNLNVINLDVIFVVCPALAIENDNILCYFRYDIVISDHNEYNQSFEGAFLQ